MRPADVGRVRDWLVGLRVDPYVVFPGTEDAQVVDGDLVRAHDTLLDKATACSRRGDLNGWAAAWTNAAGLAVQLGWYERAERRLTVVLARAERVPLRDGVVAEARMTLANVQCATGRQAEAEKKLRAWGEVYSPGSFEAAMYRESLAVLYAETEREEQALGEVQEALTVYRSLGKPIRILEAQATLAWVLLTVDDQEAGEQVFAQVRQSFVELRRPERVAACDYNWANHLVNQGRYAEADDYFDSAEDGLRAARMHHQLANLQWNRVRRLKAEADSLVGSDPEHEWELRRRAADVAISAVIAADYERFQFDDVPRRVRWMQHLGQRLAKAFRLAHHFGDEQLVADLIESALNAGVYVTVAPDEVEPDTYPVTPLDRGPVEQVADESGWSDHPMALLHGATALLSTSLLPVSPPPALIDGDGREVLGPQRAMAARLDPDLDRILAAAPRVAIW